MPPPRRSPGAGRASTRGRPDRGAAGGRRTPSFTELVRRGRTRFPSFANRHGREVQRVPLVGMRVATASSSSTPRPGSFDGMTLPSSNRSSSSAASRGSRPTLDRFQDQEVRAAGRELDVGGADDRPAIAVRRDLDVVASAMPAIFLVSRMPPERPRSGCRMVAAPHLDDAGELEFGRQPLAGGDRDRRRPRDLAPSLRACRAAPAPRTTADRRARARAPCAARPTAVNWPCVPNRMSALVPTASRIAFTMRAEQVDVVEPRLVAVEGGVGAGRVELDRVEALLDVDGRAFGREIGVVVDVRVGVAGRCAGRGRCRCAASRAPGRRAACRPACRPPCR